MRILSCCWWWWWWWWWWMVIMRNRQHQIIITESSRFFDILWQSLPWIKGLQSVSTSNGSLPAKHLLPGKGTIASQRISAKMAGRWSDVSGCFKWVERWNQPTFVLHWGGISPLDFVYRLKQNVLCFSSFGVSKKTTKKATDSPFGMILSFRFSLRNFPWNTCEKARSSKRQHRDLTRCPYRDLVWPPGKTVSVEKCWWKAVPYHGQMGRSKGCQGGSSCQGWSMYFLFFEKIKICIALVRIAWLSW